jgi:CheY-like chemotaxis protein
MDPGKRIPLMTKILIADDDRNFLLSVADGLRDYSKDFEIFIAENGKEAVTQLQTNKIDLLVTDLKMPEMDGLELLAHMVSYYPNIPVIVMTAFATRELEDCVANMGAFKFLEKPLDFHVLLEKIKEGMDVGSRHITKVLSIISFLQTLESEGKTCRVTVRSNENIGYLYFFNGVLIDGDTGETNGAESVYIIIAWEDAEVEIDYNFMDEKRKIDTPLNFIIKEELHRQSQMADINKVPAKSDGNMNDKETNMNTAKMEEAIDILKRDMADALLNTGVMSRLDGRMVLEYKIHPKAGIFFKQLTAFLKRMLSECNMPPMGKYYMIELEGDKSLIAIPHLNYIWGITIDLKKVALGLFLNVTLPKILKAFDVSITTK